MSFVTRLARCLALVAGFVVLSGVAQAACSSPPSVAGGFNYNSSQQRFEYCDTSDTWKPLGASVVASLTDVSITNLSGRDYLRYDAGASKWVNISESTVMSTTTMVPNWPDAIRCNEGSVDVILYRAAESSGTNYYVEPYSSGSDYMVAFNSSGSYVSQVTRDYNNCKTSIATISAAGRAFNFIGNASSSGALGDRLTSGTLPYAVTVNSATGIISLSSAATTWGYLGSGASFLPTVTANKVSSTAVSGSIIQVGNTGASCSSGINGSIRYNGGNLQYCNGSVWTSLSSSTAAGVTDRIVSGTTNAIAYQDGSLTITTAGTQRMIVGEDGRVGIGTTDPRAPLHVGSGLAVGGATSAISSTLANENSIQITTDTYFGGTYNNHSGYIIYSTLASGWGATQLHFARSTNWGMYDLVTPTLTLGSGVIAGRFVGINNTSPKATMDVGGTISASDAIQVGSSSLTCGAGIAGAIRYNAGSMEYCNGSSWTSIASGAASAVSSTGAIQFNVNNQLAGDTDNLFWHNSNKRLGVGTATPGATVEISSSEALRLSKTGGTANNTYVSWLKDGVRQAYMGYGVPGSYFSINMENNNSLHIGGGNVGIGTTVASTTLYVNGLIGGGFGAIGTGGVLDWNDITNARPGSGDTLLRGSTASNAPNTGDTAYFHPFSFEYSTKSGGGNLTQFAVPYSPAASLVQGMYMRGRTSGTWTGWYKFIVADPSGNAIVPNNLTAAAFLYSSDKRLKRNIQTLTGGLAKLDGLEPITFSYISDTTHRQRLGLIAQDVEKVFPQAVVTGDDGYKKVDYPSLVPVLINAVKELKAANDEQRAEGEKQLIELRTANDNLLRRIEALEARKASMR